MAGEALSVLAFLYLWQELEFHLAAESTSLRECFPSMPPRLGSALALQRKKILAA